MEVATFLEPSEVVNDSLQSQDKDVHLFPVTQTSWLTLLQKEVDCHLGTGTLAEFLNHEGCHPQQSGECSPLCMKAPSVVAAAIATRQLRHVMLLARWPCKQRLFLRFTPECLFAKVPRGMRVPAQESIPLQATSVETVHKLEAVAEFLRSLAPHVQDNPPPGWTSDLIKEALQEHVINLGQLASSLDPQRPMETDSVTHFPAQGLIRWMQVASLLRNRGRLKEVVEVAVMETVPIICHGKAKQQLNAKRGGLPSRETIRRSRFTFDAALSLHARKLLAQPLSLYVGADSSPQGDSNWLLVQMDLFVLGGVEEKIEFVIAWHSLWRTMRESSQHGLATLLADEDMSGSEAEHHESETQIAATASVSIEQDDGKGVDPRHSQTSKLHDIRLRATIDKGPTNPTPVILLSSVRCTVCCLQLHCQEFLEENALSSSSSVVSWSFRSFCEPEHAQSL